MTNVTTGMARGARGGAIGTAVMTALMVAGQRAGLMGEMPPRKITRAALRGLGLRPRRRTQQLGTTLSHLGFGVAVGALFGALTAGDRRPRPLPAALLGAGYGTLVWLVSYAGWVPALGIMPPPRRDRPGRQGTMLAAHLLYGAVLGALTGRRHAA